MVVMTIIGILGAISVVLYSQYVVRARSSDILVKYDAARSSARANLAANAIAEQCFMTLDALGAKTIDDEYVRLSYQFEAVQSGNQAGYRPVLAVCAMEAKQGRQAVRIARAAHDEIVKTQRVEARPVLLDTVVSFSLPLTEPGQVVCMFPAAIALDACGQSKVSCPPGREPAVIPAHLGFAERTLCVLACAQGEARDPNGANPLVCKPVGSP
jgi:hypothetical protein